MVLCPVCNKENNDEEYCSDCGTKLVDIEKNPNFEFKENNEIKKFEELNIYLKGLNQKINDKQKYLDELNNDPLIKKYETITKINEENTKLKNKIKQLEQNNKTLSSELRQQKQTNSRLQSEINDLKNKGPVINVIKDMIKSKTNNKNYSNANFCPKCGYKLY